LALTKIEKETIILFNEGDDTAEIYTHNQKLKNKLKNAAVKHPETFLKTDSDQYGGVAYTFPKKLLTIVLREPMTDEQQKQRRERYKTSNLARYKQNIKP